MITLRDPTLLDVLAMCLQMPAEERQQYEAFTGVPYDPDSAAVEAWSWGGPRWAAVDENDVPAAVGGFIRQRKGVYRTWFFAPESMWPVHGRELTRVVRRLISAMLASDAHRIETIALASRKRACQWYSTIGLWQESVQRGYGVGGEDAAVFVALRKDSNVRVE